MELKPEEYFIILRKFQRYRELPEIQRQSVIIVRILQKSMDLR